MSKVAKVTLRRLRLPLVQPYRLSYRTFEEFEPFLVEIDTDDGRNGFADGHISPGSSSETREGGWAFLTDAIEASLGRDTEDLKAARACAVRREQGGGDAPRHGRRSPGTPSRPRSP